MQVGLSQGWQVGWREGSLLLAVDLGADQRGVGRVIVKVHAERVARLPNIVARGARPLPALAERDVGDDRGVLDAVQTGELGGVAEAVARQLRPVRAMAAECFGPCGRSE